MHKGWAAVFSVTVLVALALTLTLTALVWVVPAAAQSRSVFWQHWDVLIDNVDTAANQFDVTETHDVHFSGTFRFGSRVIETDRLDDISNLRISQGKTALQQGLLRTAGDVLRHQQQRRTFDHLLFHTANHRRQRYFYH